MADRDVYWTGAVSNAANVLGNWQLFDGSPLTHPPGEWEDDGWTVTTHDKLFFLGARRVRECTNWNIADNYGAITRGILVDAAYAAASGSYVIGDEDAWVLDNVMFSGMSDPGEVVLVGAGTLMMGGKWGFSWQGDIYFYGTSSLGLGGWMNTTPTCHLYSGNHEFGPAGGSGETLMWLHDWDACFIEGYGQHKVKIHEDAQDDVVPDVSVVKHGETFGVGSAKIGTLVVPRRSC